MATDRYPQRNHNVPMPDGAVSGARQALLDPGSTGPSQPPVTGKGSRREVRPGEWVDDRVIQIGGPASPSEGDPPEWKRRDSKILPTFTPGKVYDVKLGKSCTFAGRILNPSMKFQMTGETCLDAEVQPCIIDAVELGDTPVSPDAPPSE
jgi:hypothetical protein